MNRRREQGRARGPRAAAVVLPGLLVIGMTAGCGTDEAPTAKAPTAKSPSNPPSVATSAAPSSGAAASGAVPTVATAPSTPAGPDPSKVCTSDADDDSMAHGVGKKTQHGSWGKTLRLDVPYAGTLKVTAAKPTSKKRHPSNTYGPKAGQAYLLVKISEKYVSGKASTLADGFVLRDPKGNMCDPASPTGIDGVVPQQQVFAGNTISKSTKTYSGTLVFIVPAGQDYSKFSLLYPQVDATGKNPDAALAWTS